MKRYLYLAVFYCLILSGFFNVLSYEQVSDIWSQHVKYVGRWDLTGKTTGFSTSQWPGSQLSFYVQTSDESSCTVTVELTGCIDDCHYFIDVEARNMMINGTSPNVHEIIEVTSTKNSIDIQFKPESIVHGYNTWHIILTNS